MMCFFGRIPRYLICLLFVFFLFPFPGFSAKKLDTNALKNNIVERTVASWGEQDLYYKAFDASKVVIEKEVPIEAGDLSLFAVKAVLETPRDVPDEILFLVVDSTGRLQFPDVLDIGTGQSFCKEILLDLRRIDNLPKNFGTLIFEGKGMHDVVIISDPFCPYCRKGWSYFQGKREKMRSLRLSHFPLNGHSELVCMALRDAETRKDRALEMVDFVYGTLKQTANPEDMIKQFMDAFPHLKKIWGRDAKNAISFLDEKYGEKIREKVFETKKLGIKATPVFFIDGYMIEGYHEKQIRERMP